MKLPQLTLRDLFWLVALVAMGLAWWRERTRAGQIEFDALFEKMTLIGKDGFNRKTTAHFAERLGYELEVEDGYFKFVSTGLPPRHFVPVTAGPPHREQLMRTDETRREQELRDSQD